MSTTLMIGRRFNGPASSGNGGWSAGSLAAASGLVGPVTVRLHRPPPLEQPLEVATTGEGAELRAADGLVATAMPAATPTWSPIDPVDVTTAAETSYAGHRDHPFPTCFVCGPDRTEGDGLRIFPGPVRDSVVAATWTPPADLVDQPVPLTWAALDCVSAWSTELEKRPLVLGQMTAELRSPPQAGSTYVVVGRHVGTDGRKVATASALYDGAGTLLARAEHVWLEISPEVLAALRG